MVRIKFRSAERSHFKEFKCPFLLTKRRRISFWLEVICIALPLINIYFLLIWITGYHINIAIAIYENDDTYKILFHIFLM